MTKPKPQRLSGLEDIIEDIHTFFKHIEAKKYNPKYLHDAERGFVLHYRYRIGKFYNMIDTKYNNKRDVEALNDCHFNKYTHYEVA